MPAAAKLMADNQMPAGSVAGSGKDGRVTKGDVLASVAAAPYFWAYNFLPIGLVGVSADPRASGSLRVGDVVGVGAREPEHLEIGGVIEHRHRPEVLA